ncbi:hypothetical protein B0H17DRAFT_1102091 [Mycena rosella]|uniref:PWWP domain-containing protein n=1 Tax=Mycena rosella TaxID=1033263 RepID=A0AAD7CL69_MYCRO|nr:hypothetical protein B0H17DRAFT_1102091 [Mycena rosella]
MSAKKTSASAKKTEVEMFDTREVVLGKLRGFPPWPGMVVDSDTVPKAVSKERPTNKKTIAYALLARPQGAQAPHDRRHQRVRQRRGDGTQGRGADGGVSQRARPCRVGEGAGRASPAPAQKTQEQKQGEEGRGRGGGG